MLAAALMVTALGLFGCGAAQQAAVRKEVAQTEQLMATEFSDKRLDPIRGKVPFFGNRGIVSTTVGESCPDDTEKQAINVLREKILVAKSRYYSLANQFSFYDSSEVMSFLNIEDYNLSRLYKCQLNFQTYIDTMNRALDSAKESSLAKKRDYEEQERIKSQQAAAAFGAALQSAGQAMQQQEAIRQANRQANQPRQTTCRKNGDKIDCTTF
jgi:hypothetical protein